MIDRRAMPEITFRWLDMTVHGGKISSPEEADAFSNVLCFLAGAIETYAPKAAPQGEKVTPLTREKDAGQ